MHELRDYPLEYEPLNESRMERFKNGLAARRIRRQRRRASSNTKHTANHGDGALVHKRRK